MRRWFAGIAITSRIQTSYDQYKFDQPKHELKHNDALAPLYGLLLRWGFPCKHDPTPGERHFGQPVPKPFRIASGTRLVVSDGQRPMGIVQPDSGLPTCCPRWPVRAAPIKACGCSGTWGTDHGTHAGADIW